MQNSEGVERNDIRPLPYPLPPLPILYYTPAQARDSLSLSLFHSSPIVRALLPAHLSPPISRYNCLDFCFVTRSLIIGLYIYILLLPSYCYYLLLLILYVCPSQVHLTTTLPAWRFPRKHIVHTSYILYI